MNFITFEKAYCLYPRATLNRFFNLILKPETPTLYRALRKYQNRGWIHFRLLSPTARSIFLDDRVRWVEGNGSLVVPLPAPVDVRHWPPYTSPLSVTTWSISLRAGEHYRLVSDLIRKEPAIYPLFGATGLVNTRLDAICTELWDTGNFVAGHRTITGGDRYVCLHIMYRIISDVHPHVATHSLSWNVCTTG